jgi:hypothetical protein
MWIKTGDWGIPKISRVGRRIFRTAGALADFLVFVILVSLGGG